MESIVSNEHDARTEDELSEMDLDSVAGGALGKVPGAATRGVAVPRAAERTGAALSGMVPGAVQGTGEGHTSLQDSGIK